MHPARLPAMNQLQKAPATVGEDNITEASLDQLAGLLKAAGDPLRLDILRVLAQDSFGVLELCQIFSIKQSGMSHHLKVLTSAGLLASRREGNSIFYRRAFFGPDHPLSALQQQLFTTVDQRPVSAAVASQPVL